MTCFGLQASLLLCDSGWCRSFTATFRLQAIYAFSGTPCIPYRSTCRGICAVPHVNGMQLSTVASALGARQAGLPSVLTALSQSVPWTPTVLSSYECGRPWQHQVQRLCSFDGLSAEAPLIGSKSVWRRARQHQWGAAGT